MERLSNLPKATQLVGVAEGRFESRKPDSRAPFPKPPWNWDVALSSLRPSEEQSFGQGHIAA